MAKQTLKLGKQTIYLEGDKAKLPGGKLINTATLLVSLNNKGERRKLRKELVKMGRRDIVLDAQDDFDGRGQRPPY